MTKNKPRKLSASQILQWLNCQYMYYLKYVKYIKFPQTFAMIRGSMVHGTIQAFWNHVDPPTTLEELEAVTQKMLNIGEEKWKIYRLNNYKKDVDIEKEKIRTMDMLFHYVTQLTWAVKDTFLQGKFPMETAWKFERPRREMKYTLKDLDGNQTFVGIIDAVKERAGKTILVDDKTSKVYIIEYDDDYIKQIMMYGWLYWRMTDIMPDLGAVRFLITGKMPFVKYTKEGLLETENMIEDVREEISEAEKSGVFKKNRNFKFCDKRWCQGWELCHEEDGESSSGENNITKVRKRKRK